MIPKKKYLNYVNSEEKEIRWNHKWWSELSAVAKDVLAK